MGAVAGKGAILVVEDTEEYRHLYRTLLRSDGYEVMEAEDGRQALQLIEDHEFKLILLDLILPEVDGFEVLERIRANERTKSVPVIIFTVLGDREQIRRAVELGADDYIIKGMVAPRDVLGKIHSRLAKAEAQEATKAYRVAVKKGSENAALLGQDYGFTKLFTCPECGGDVWLELIPDKSRTEGSWLLAHFLCSNCGKAF